MGDTKMGGDDSNEGAAWKGRLIPGVDGDKIFGFPPNVISKLRYVENYLFTSTAGSVNINNFRMNSIADPDQTGVGHQPMYHDIFALLYRRYRVLGSKLTVTWVPVNDVSAAGISSSSGPYWVGINGTEATASVSAVTSTRAEMNDSITNVMGPRNGPDGVVTQVWTYDPERDLGIVAADDTVSAVFGSSPNFIYYAQVWFADQTGATSSAYAKVDIEYTVEFYQPLPQAQS